MLYLLKDKDFFIKAVAILRERGIFNIKVWEFALYHCDDEDMIREYLEMCKKSQKGKDKFIINGYFKSPLLTVGEDDASNYKKCMRFTKLLEYHPMVNARAHLVGKDGGNKILNTDFRRTYDDFLETLV